MKRKIGISTFTLQNLYGNENVFEIANRVGADCVDFNLYSDEFDCEKTGSIYSKSDNEIIEYFSGLKRKADQYGIEVAMTHGRGSTFKNIPEWDNRVVKNARIDCLATSVLGAPVCVMHGVSNCSFPKDVDPELLRKLNFELFTTVLPFARQYGIKIATETLGDAPNHGCCCLLGCTDEFIKTYDKICEEGGFDDCFATCMDTGHTNKAMRFDNPTSGNAIRMIGESLIALHLHDNNGLTDQHKIPLTGSIDWKDVFDALDEIGYNGVYNLEISLDCFGKGIEIETAEYAVKVMRNFLNTRYK
ncbi:MAG: sugar phosphate isomerase/epimerase [Clostridia bacterium]|nr:sugar phosphate isomerase/epimerase [Clostridia bacterium]